MNLIVCISYTSTIFQLIWVIILWCPLIYLLHVTGSLTYLYDQLTWWGWTLQCVFYSYMHMKQSICYKKIRSILYHKCCDKQSKENYKIIAAPVEMYFFGMVCGVTWFIFLQFIYVLYHNPDLVYNKSKLFSNKGIPQLVNIFIHYYIIAAVPLWTVFNFRYIHHRIKTFNIKESIIFSIVWLLFVFLYLCYWQFNVHGIFKNYSIDDISFSSNIMYTMACIIIVCLFNLVYLYSIKKNLNKIDKLPFNKIDRKIYVINEESESSSTENT